jgi:hypothetical protein
MCRELNVGPRKLSMSRQSTSLGVFYDICMFKSVVTMVASIKKNSKYSVVPSSPSDFSVIKLGYSNFLVDIDIRSFVPVH